MFTLVSLDNPNYLMRSKQDIGTRSIYGRYTKGQQFIVILWRNNATTNQIASGTSATAETRCDSQCSVPLLAEPCPRNLPSGDSRLMTSLPATTAP